MGASLATTRGALPRLGVLAGFASVDLPVSLHSNDDFGGLAEPPD